MLLDRLALESDRASDIDENTGEYSSTRCNSVTRAAFVLKQDTMRKELFCDSDVVFEDVTLQSLLGICWFHFKMSVNIYGLLH